MTRTIWFLLALAACSKAAHPPRVFLLNGLDIAVTVEITADGGSSERFELPAHGRVTADVSGMATVKVTSAKGELISEGKAQFGKPGGCKRIYSVVGAAAYVHEDVVYGTGFGAAEYRRRAGEISEEECGVSFAFEDPSKAVSVDRNGPAGDNRGWIHYEGDGGWVVAVTSLLNDTGRWASQSRGAAQRIVRAVVTHDPGNAALPAIEARLTELGLAIPTPSPGNLLAAPPSHRPTVR